MGIVHYNMSDFEFYSLLSTSFNPIIRANKNVLHYTHEVRHKPITYQLLALG